MNEYEECWIETYTGLKFHFKEPQPEEVCIEDIAHSLSLKCRYSGHCKYLYSVAQHSLHVAFLLPGELKLSGLLHDATEAYMPDVPRPVKVAFGLQEFEARLWRVIAEKYGLISSRTIKEADNLMLSTEASQIMANTTDWAELPKPLKYTIDYYPPEHIEELFLDCFKRYGGKE